MIHMLSRFDLKPGIDPATFQAHYDAFFEQMRAAGLAERTGKVGRREADTPMDTDDDNTQTHYVVMSFKDRDQMDRAYEHIVGSDERSRSAHPAVHRSITNSVFTCWRDYETREK